jgi:hypothetical protein
MQPINTSVAEWALPLPVARTDMKVGRLAGGGNFNVETDC